MKHKTKSTVLIETGTYLGVTTKRCSPIFDKIYTIELDHKLAEQAKSYLSNNKNVEVIQSDALDILTNVLDKNDINNILLFLDAHFSGGVTACGDYPEPAIEELKIIARYKSKVKCIIIDDFRLFGSEKGFPSKSELLKNIEDNFDNFDVNVYLD